MEKAKRRSRGKNKRDTWGKFISRTQLEAVWEWVQENRYSSELALAYEDACASAGAVFLWAGCSEHTLRFAQEATKVLPPRIAPAILEDLGASAIAVRDRIGRIILAAIEADSATTTDA